jgi:hypothetical protein
MDENTNAAEPIIKPLPSLLEFGRRMEQGPYQNESEELFYTCPQCGHPMVTKKCKIVCYTCHYFIGCVE